MQLTGKILLYILCFGIAAYALGIYGFMELGSFGDPDIQANFKVHPYGIYTHIFAAAIALILGPFQFSMKLRRKYTRLHRWLGRIYLGIGVLLGGAAGLYMSQFAFGGVMAKTGFGCLAICWLFTGVRAYLAVRSGEIAAHQRWMIRNFSLTLAAVSLRLYLPIAEISGFAFEVSYPVTAWMCWVPNIVFAEWWFISRSKVKQGEPQQGSVTG
jgi:uncharacterized membrane protein